ncbi:MAG: hypothetical protein AABZ65_00350 [Candidatus Omnitrophota bacterium]
MKTFAIGDIHGAYKAMMQCFERSKFDYKKDRTLQPIHVCNVWNIDTGAGWSGKLTIIDVDTKEYWQSDLTPDLYGGTPDKL